MSIVGTGSTVFRYRSEDGTIVFEGTVDEITKALAERTRYRNGLLAILDAIDEGRVCDDVAWFSSIETLHDYVDELLHPSEPAAVGDLFEEPKA